MGRHKKPTLNQTPAVLKAKAVKIPDPPTHLNEGALREWNRIATGLFEAGQLTTLDQSALAMWCVTVDRWEQMEVKIAKEGLIIFTQNNFPVQSPYLNISQACQKHLILLLKEFGFSPSARHKFMGEAKASIDNKVLTFVKNNGS